MIKFIRSASIVAAIGFNAFVAFAEDGILGARNDYPRNRYFTINSDVFFIGSEDSHLVKKLKDQYLIRVGSTVLGTLPIKSDFVFDEPATGQNIYLKHRYSQFMLGVEQVTETYKASATLPDHPSIDKLKLKLTALNIQYLFEFGRLLFVNFNFALGVSVANVDLTCNSVSCESDYPDTKAKGHDMYGGIFQVGFFVGFIGVYLGQTLYGETAPELKPADDNDASYEFKIGKPLTYAGLTIRI